MASALVLPALRRKPASAVAAAALRLAASTVSTTSTSSSRARAPMATPRSMTARTLCSSSAGDGSSSSGSGSGSGKDKGKKKPAVDAKAMVPDDFFDEESESEKEFLDIASSLVNGNGLESLTTVKETLTWDKVEGGPIGAVGSGVDFGRAVKAGSNSEEIELEAEALTESIEAASGPQDSVPHGPLIDALSNPDLAEHIEEFYPKTFHLPVDYMNYTVPWRKEGEFPHPLLDRFVPDTAPERFRHDRQGMRACPGKMQRRGKEGALRCHLIDLDELHYLDVLTLRKYLTQDSEIVGRKDTGLCAKCQRQVAKTIKRARNFGLVPHLGQFIVQDSRPLHKDEFFHDDVRVAADAQRDGGEGGDVGGAAAAGDSVSSGYSHGLKESKTVL